MKIDSSLIQYILSLLLPDPHTFLFSPDLLPLYVLFRKERQKLKRTKQDTVDKAKALIWRLDKVIRGKESHEQAKESETHLLLLICN